MGMGRRLWCGEGKGRFRRCVQQKKCRANSDPPQDGPEAVNNLMTANHRDLFFSSQRLSNMILHIQATTTLEAYGDESNMSF